MTDPNPPINVPEQGAALVQVSPTVATAAPVAPPAAGRPLSTSSIIAFVLVCLIAFGYMTVKLIVIAFNTDLDPAAESLATVFGVLGLLSLLPIVAVLVLGHLGLRKAAAQLRSRVFGAVALGAGYLLLALYFNRIIVSIIAVLEPHSATTFVQDNYYWL